MLNYEIDPLFLGKYVPRGTIVDSFMGKTYVSLVGFRFCRTRLFGTVAFPFHSDFEEVNLRFYVRRREGTEDRRGVVFIAEIVPRQAVATIARLVYGENYRCLPMTHRCNSEGESRSLEYRWRVEGVWCHLSAQSSSAPALPSEGSLEQFITEHYWGYSTQRGGGSLEYRVEHVPWKVWPSAVANFQGDASSLYGQALAGILRRPPDSAFIADGSPVVVFKGRKVR